MVISFFYKFATGVKFRFNDPIEKYLSINPNKDIITPKQQQQIHIGIMPTPKLNPAVETTDFQNSAFQMKYTYHLL